MPDTSIGTADILAIDASVTQSTGSTSFGVTTEGFVAKPFARLLAEKLALARALFGDDVDLTSGSAIRKLLEISALEDARTWVALAGTYQNQFIVSAVGDALSYLGLEVGIPRPYLEAQGKITLRLQGPLPDGYSSLTIPYGARLLTPGGHHVATTESAVLSPANPQRDMAVSAFYPGPEHNLDPNKVVDGVHTERIESLNLADSKLAEVATALQIAQDAGKPFTLQVQHTVALSGGELRWPDTRYRALLLQAPRSLWTVDAIRLAVSLVPGVRQVTVRDALGGLDIYQSIFGNFNFIERVFGSERDLGSLYYFTVLVAPTEAAIWEGPDGLLASVLSAIEDLRPIGIFPRVELAEQIYVGVQTNLVVRGVPLPSGSRATVNASAPALALKARLAERLRQSINSLDFAESVRASEVTWTIMNEPGVIDVQDLHLLRYPAAFDSTDPIATLDCGQNIDMRVNQIPVFVDNDTRLTII